MKKVLVACGNGIATSTVVATKIREAFEDNGLTALVSQCKLMEIDSKASDYDLIVTSGRFSSGDVKIPVISAISLLTGIGEEETLEEIINFIKQ